jgi:hypothetical protein
MKNNVVGLMAVLILLGPFMASCKKEATTEPVTIDALIVRDNEIAGWSYTGSPWSASTVAELTTYIDGMADVYQRHGFVEAVHQGYKGRVNSVAVELRLTVFDLAAEANASAVYAEPALGYGGALDWKGGAGQAAHYVRNGGLSQALAFYRGRHFVTLEINADSDESLTILQQFALNVDGKIKNG